MSPLPHYVVVLSNWMQPGGVLNGESRLRMEKGVAVLNQDPDALLVTTGWGFASEPDLTIAQAMADYAVALGVSADRIRRNPRARDTVGDAIFFARDILPPPARARVTLVSGPDHIGRAQAIFSAVLGDRAVIETAPSDGPGADDAQTHSKSLAAFEKTFSGIEPGDLAAFETRLFEAHPFYNGDIYARDAAGVSPARTPSPER